jgi:hypothetical protein
MKLEKYTKVTGALRTPKFREIIEDSIESKKGDKITALNTAVVEASNGMKFYADPTSRIDMSDAIAIALDEGLTETTWKLAEEYNGSKIQVVQLDTLKEARRLAIEYKGAVIGIVI